MSLGAVLPPQRLLLSVVLAAAVLLGGCMGGRFTDPGERRPKVQFEVDSDPLGGMVRVNGIRVGTTPTGVALEVGEDGMLWSDVVLTVDQRINPRARGSDEVGVIVFRAGEELPARLFFPLGEEPRRSGRALLRVQN